MEQQRENETVVRRTLLTVAAMLAASVTFVGTVSLLTVFIVGRATAEPSSSPSVETSKVDTFERGTGPGSGVHPEPKIAPKAGPMHPVQGKSSPAI
jgi:hypothetical protein